MINTPLLSERQHKMIPSLHPNYDDRTPEIIRDLRNMKNELIEQIDLINKRLDAIESLKSNCSREIAEHFKTGKYKAGMVLMGMKEMGITDFCTRWDKVRKATVRTWKLIVTREQALARLTQASLLIEVGIDEEDVKWQQHYRNQWIARHQRMGIKPKLHILYD